MAVSLKNHVWTVVRRSVLIYGIVSFLTIVGVYGAVLVWVKSHALKERLQIAHINVTNSIDAGDWDLAYATLNANTQAGQLFNLQLRDLNNKINLVGPLGKRESGFGTYCALDATSKNFQLSGCITILGWPDLYPALLFVVFSVLTLGLSFLFFRRKTLQLFEQISALVLSENMDVSSEINEIEFVRSRIRALLYEAEQSSKSRAFGLLAARVAHDIRSPLAVLKMVLTVAKEMPDEQKQIVRNAVTRIQDIAANLSEKNREVTKKVALEQITSIVDNIVNEKMAINIEDCEIKCFRDYAHDAHMFFSKVQTYELGAIISNLLNNSIEARIGKEIEITIRIYSKNSELVIEIQDNGKGIPSEILPKITKQGATFGKSNGSGIGLYNAKVTLAAWQGRLEISSELGLGTNVRIFLPQFQAPAWLANAINLQGKNTIVVIDDDNSIFELWKLRLTNFNIRSDAFICLKSPVAALDWIEKNREQIDQSLFLVDMDFAGSKLTGLDLIQEAEISKNSIVVTGRYDDEQVQSVCEKIQVPLYPKQLLGMIPIHNVGKRAIC